MTWVTSHAYTYDCTYRHRNLIAVPSLKQPWRRRKIREAEHRAMKELERELKEAKEREKEVSMIMSIRNLYAHTLGSSPYV